MFPARAQDVVIPDPGLNAAIREALQKPSDPLTVSDLLTLTNLDAKNRHISTLEGLEAARNLEALDLGWNSLTNFSFPSELTNLTNLDLSFNAITQCSFPNEPTRLTTLVLADNRLANLSFPESLIGLTSLDLEDNQFASLNLASNLTSIRILDIGFNSLTEFSLPIGFTNLETLILAGNQLTGLTLPEGLPALTDLDLRINQLTNFNLFQSLGSLKELDLNENKLNSFGVPAGMTNLTILDLSFNSLTNVALPLDLTNLMVLDLEFNRFAKLDLSPHLTGLKQLLLRSNALTRFVLPADMTALTRFDIGENNLTELALPTGLGQLNSIRISGNTNLLSLTLPVGMTNLTGVFLRGNQLTNLTLPPDLNRLVTLDALANRLTTLTLPTGLSNLNELALSGNLLTNLTLPPDMTQLTWLVLNGNPLTTIVLSEPLAATNLADTVASLRTNGIPVYTYPLTIQLSRVRQPIGAFQFAITGPPGLYTVVASADLATWSPSHLITNSVGAVVFTDAEAHLVPQRFYRALLQEAPANMVLIQPNTFIMGSPEDEIERSLDEGPQTVVTLSQAFWIGKFLVTQQDYLDVMRTNVSGFLEDLRRPVETVTWLDATNYCARLTQLELSAGHIPPGSRYRLPTEAEWECAARAGTSSRYNYGEDPGASALADHAWYSANSGASTHPVGLKQPNAWGLYDMEGNVWEWCQDWYGPYPGGTQTDPKGPESSAAEVKVIRGGAWDAFDSDCRSARRFTKAVSPFISDISIGFRVVLATDP